MNLRLTVLAILATGFCSTVLRAEDKSGEYTAYLASYFWEKKTADGNENSQLYYAISTDGFKFKHAVNHDKPILRSTLNDQLIRDPQLMRGPDGTFHLVATVSWKKRPFTLWDSKDLIHWENERLIDVAPKDSCLTWAPELLWDPETQQYVAYWTGAINEQWDTACIRYATSRDLMTFSEPNILMKEEKGCLDADIIHAKGKWYMVYRYFGIWMRSADKALGPYENPVRILDLNVEGPFVFPINGKSDQWGLVFDYFGGNRGRWGLATSSDLTNWELVSNKDWPHFTPDFFMPAGVRHGSVLPITQKEADAILKAFGSTLYDHNGTMPQGLLVSARSFAAQEGTKNEGEKAVGYLDEGDWIQYKGVDLTGKGRLLFSIATADEYAGKTIEVRLDSVAGPVVARLTVAGTGGWGSFDLQEAPLEKTDGVHDVFLTFKGGSSVGNIESIDFVERR